MPEVKIKYRTKKSRQALQDLGKYFEWELIEETKSIAEKKSTKKKSSLPITWAEKPDIKALAGIWKNKQITQEELREKAWGKRR